MLAVNADGNMRKFGLCFSKKISNNSVMGSIWIQHMISVKMSLPWTI